MPIIFSTGYATPTTSLGNEGRAVELFDGKALFWRSHRQGDRNLDGKLHLVTPARIGSAVGVRIEVDQNAADEMPDEAVRPRLVLADDPRKLEQAKDAERIAVNVSPGLAERGRDEDEGVECILRPQGGALLDGRNGRLSGGHAERGEPDEPHDHDDQDKRAQRLVEGIKVVPERPPARVASPDLGQGAR
jgi:hypothetical protein